MQACIFAAAGDEDQLSFNIDSALHYDGNALHSIQRNSAFDPYREKPWFKRRFGPTLDTGQPPAVQTSESPSMESSTIALLEIAGVVALLALIAFLYYSRIKRRSKS